MHILGREVSGCPGQMGCAVEFGACVSAQECRGQVVGDKAQCWVGELVVVPHCKTPADQPSGISCSAPGSTVSRHTLTSTTGDGWCWTCRYGESSCLGARRSVQGNTVGAASVKGGSTYTHSTQTPCPCGAWRSVRRMDGRSLTPQPGPGFSHHTSSQHALGTKA